MIRVSDYSYDLPEDRIAAFPLAERDQSKLLVYREGEISHARFEQLAEFLPANSLLFFNDTKVIPARILFTKETGAVIEIFLLNPHLPHRIPEAMQATTSVEWQCTIGNLKRWPDGTQLRKISGENLLTAELVNRNESIVRFTWTPADLSFAEILTTAGATPLPPYIKRSADAGDQQRYQTVYSHAEGAVAAPTAGLHFSDRVIDTLKGRGMITDFLTLHVSAGTFQPVKAENAVDHAMHREQVIITRQNIENLLREDRVIVAVGTTSLRTLESIYWFGVRLLKNPAASFDIEKLEPYPDSLTIPAREAFEAVALHMDDSGMDTLFGETSILILPGYTFKTARALITNFHQPGSTLMLLVAAFVGEDWRKIYQTALGHDYRFLSYGDSSLLFGGAG